MQLDAYTIRKMAPRLLIAVVAVNLSIYLCLAAVDITNIVGKGLGQLLLTPFQDAEVFKIKINGNTTNGIIGGTGALAGAGVLSAILAVIFGSTSAFALGSAVLLASAPAILAGLLPFLFLAVVGIGFVALAVLLTVIIRQGLLVFLIIVSPIAIALFVLPGTEKYFKQWWSIFLKTLMVYPIIAAIFAMSDILGAIIMDGANDKNVEGTAGLAMIMTGIIVVYAPLFLIPFAFKFAGGVLGAINDIAQGQAGKASGGLRGKIRESAKNPNSWLGGLSKRSKEAREEMNLTPGGILSSTSQGLRSKGRGGSFRKGYADRKRHNIENSAFLNSLKADELDVAKGLTDDDGHMLREYTKQKAAGASDKEAFDAALKAGREAAPLRFLDRKLDANNAEDRKIIDKARDKAAANGETFNEAEYLSEFNADTAVQQRRQSLGSAMARVDHVRGKVGDQTASLLASHAIAKATTGYDSPADMLRYAIEAANGDSNLALRNIDHTKKLAMQANMTPYGGGGLPDAFADGQQMILDIAANRTVEEDGKRVREVDSKAYKAKVSASLINSMVAKQPPNTIANTDPRGMKQIVESGVIVDSLKKAFKDSEDSGTLKPHAEKVALTLRAVENVTGQLKTAKETPGISPGAVQSIENALNISKHEHEGAQQGYIAAIAGDENIQIEMAKANSIVETMGHTNRKNQIALRNGLSSVTFGGTSVSNLEHYMRNDERFKTYHEMSRQFLHTMRLDDKPDFRNTPEFLALSAEEQNAFAATQIRISKEQADRVADEVKKRGG